MNKQANQLQPFKTLSKKIVYQNKWIKVQEDQTIRPDGKKGLYAYVISPPAVMIVPLTEKNEVYLVKQQRYTFGGIETLEIPAGDTEGQNPLEAAKRELKEETGLSAKYWRYLGESQPFNALSNEINHFYLARGLKQTGEDKKSDDGISEVLKLPYQKVIEMVNSGTVNDGQSIVGVLKAGLYLGFLRVEK